MIQGISLKSVEDITKYSSLLPTQAATHIIKYPIELTLNLKNAKKELIVKNAQLRAKNNQRVREIKMKSASLLKRCRSLKFLFQAIENRKNQIKTVIEQIDLLS